MLLLYLAKKRCPGRYTATTKREQLNKKQNSRSLLVHIVELSTAVAEGDTKGTNASLTQNQCLQCVTPPLTVRMLRYRDCATPLN